MTMSIPGSNDTLKTRMERRADRDELPEDHELRAQARTLSTIDATTDVRKTLSIWAAARRVWCKYTGEDLI